MLVVPQRAYMHASGSAGGRVPCLSLVYLAGRFAASGQAKIEGWEVR